MTIESGRGWTMYLGDCLEIMATLDKVDHVITDPPYEAEAHTKARRSLVDGGKHGVWTHSLDHAHGGAGKNEHPTTKPLDLMLDLVRDFTDPGETILDAFAGSGTTGVAALRLGRRFIGIEKDPRYFALACERLRAEEQGTTLQAARAGQVSLFGGKS